MSKAPQGLEEVDGRACGPSFQSSVLGQVSSRPEDQCGPLSASSGFPWVFQVAWRTFSKRELNGADPKTDDECLIRTATMSPRRLFSFLLSWLPASCSTQTAQLQSLTASRQLAPCPHHSPSAGLLARLAHCVFLQPLSPHNCSLCRPGAPCQGGCKQPTNPLLIHFNTTTKQPLKPTCRQQGCPFVPRAWAK